MDNDLERQQLAHADRNIAQVRAHVVRQRQIVLDLLLADQPREEAATLLERLEESLRAFERQRQLILDGFRRPSEAQSIGANRPT